MLEQGVTRHERHIERIFTSGLMVRLVLLQSLLLIIKQNLLLVLVVHLWHQRYLNTQKR